MKIKKSLTNRLNKTIQEYVNFFCEKHDLTFYGWAGDNIGTIGLFNDYSFDFETIRYDVENDVPEDKLIEWYDYTLEQSYKKEPIINFKNFLKLTK